MMPKQSWEKGRKVVSEPYSSQMMHLLSTPSLAKMALGYSRKDAEGKLDRIDMEFWDAITTELVRRGAALADTLF